MEVFSSIEDFILVGKYSNSYENSVFCRLPRINRDTVSREAAIDFKKIKLNAVSSINAIQYTSIVFGRKQMSHGQIS